MIPFLFWISSICVSLRCFGDEASSASSQHITSSNLQTLKLDDSLKMEKWKLVGFCGYEKEPIVVFRVPAFLKWDPNCNLHTINDGVEYCGPSESSPRLRGKILVAGKERTLQVGVEAFKKKTSEISPLDKTYFDSGWGKYGALVSVEKIKLGGHEAFVANIEDRENRLPKSIKAQTLIKFSHPKVGGMFYFIETEKVDNRDKFVPHNERIFHTVINKIIESFKFKVPTE